MNKITHLHIKQQRFIGILDIGGVKFPSSVITLIFVSLRKCFLAAFTRITFSAPSALPAIRLVEPRSTYLMGEGKIDMYGLVVSDFQTMRRYHPAEAYLAAQPLEIISATLLRVRSHEARQ